MVVIILILAGLYFLAALVGRIYLVSTTLLGLVMGILGFFLVLCVVVWVIGLFADHWSKK